MNKMNSILDKIKIQIECLKDVVENNEWHRNQNVFEHSLDVLNNLEEICKGLPLNVKEKFEAKEGEFSRIDLLKIAALLHDIGKKETLGINEKGETICPNHEEAGLEKAKLILSKAEFSEMDSEAVLNIIKNHGALHSITDRLTKGDTGYLEDYNSFVDKVGEEIKLDLLLFAWADTATAGIRQTEPDTCQKRIDFYKQELGV